MYLLRRRLLENLLCFILIYEAVCLLSGRPQFSVKTWIELEFFYLEILQQIVNYTACILYFIFLLILDFLFVNFNIIVGL